ncbi:MAG: hypothetical protein ABSA03_07650 [Streptosporangiaceae bacterium]|jgi:hypothetical protein
MHMTRFVKSLAVLTLAAGPLLALGGASAATAATAAPAAAASPAHVLASAGTAATESPDPAVVRPDTMTGEVCSSSTAHWFTIHVYWDGGTWQYWCYGGAGSFSWPDDNQIAWACAGNNYGTFVYFDWATKKNVTVNFSPGWSQNLGSDDELVSLKITKWSGSDNC